MTTSKTTTTKTTSKTKGKKLGFNTNDKDHKLTVRLNAEEHAYLTQNADMLGITASALLRQVIHVSMRTSAEASKKLDGMAVKTASSVSNPSDTNVSRETKKTTTRTKKKTTEKE